MRWWGCPLCTRQFSRLTAQLDFHSGSSVKQQSADRHFAPLGNITWNITMEQLIILKAVILVQKLTFDYKINNRLFKLIIKSYFIRFKKIKIKLQLHVSYLCYLRDKTVDRHFYINRNYHGCPNDKGWLMVVDTPVANYRPCKFDRLPRMKYPYIVYGPNNKLAHYETTGTFSNFLIVISLYM